MPLAPAAAPRAVGDEVAVLEHERTRVYLAKQSDPATPVAARTLEYRIVHAGLGGRVIKPLRLIQGESKVRPWHPLPRRDGVELPPAGRAVRDPGPAVR